MSITQLRVRAQTRTFKRAHNFGFNTCHAPIVMRSDLQEHLVIARRELGMRYWRCHGTLGDDVGIVRKGADGGLEYSFSGLQRILDAGLRCGVKPFLELSFMPPPLAREPLRTICHYQGVTCPPRDFAAWGELMARLAGFLLETYGAREIGQWYFEVWNEPNLDFWAGTRAEYFELYRRAALALKKASARFRVGGPATARAEWVGEFLAFARDTRTPVDFVSTHIYPSDVAFLDSDEGAVNLLGTDFLHRKFKRVADTVRAYNPKLPIFWGEWNSSAGPYAANHDDCNNAALVCAALAGIEEYGDGSLYWNLSDIYEESRYHFKPFHGGYGMFNVDSVRKSAARAFEFWQKLGGRRLAVSGLPENPARGAFAATDGATVSVLLWNHAEPGEPPAPWPVTLTLPAAGKKAAARWILPGQGSAYETWLGMGRPATLTPAQLTALQRASVPKRSTVAAGGGGAFPLTVPAGTVCLLTVKKTGAIP
jgi:xylan 1,4-beta-xylosidase